jgi:deoxyribodipyrimidine photo-lyase
MEKDKITIFWFRRDLRLHDNTGLYHALNNSNTVLPLFIFDKHILEPLPDQRDARVSFIQQELQKIQKTLTRLGSTLVVKIGDPLEIWKSLVKEFPISTVYTNTDYEPYARQRDEKIKNLLKAQDIPFYTYKDQVIFEKDEIIKDDSQPYSVFTPYKNRWLDTLSEPNLTQFNTPELYPHFYKMDTIPLPTLDQIGFTPNDFPFPERDVDHKIIQNYHETRDFPAIQGTTRIGIHLRFGTVSIRDLVRLAKRLNSTYLSELIWREFFMMILYHHPRVVQEPYKIKYQGIQWINDEDQFQSWCEGRTGYPMVDAGMRELNETGYMHNRVRMITSSFLCKHLLIDWRWGEQYFADKLLDFELSSNNGNWQWAAGCGCDAAPYFRIFNPTTQMKKFDPDLKYVTQWVPEYNQSNYPKPMIDHKFARERALETYAEAVK